MNYYVYILKCKDNSLYTGSTNDLDRRINEHNSTKRGAHYTKIRRPVSLVYSETFTNSTKAKKRECGIKSWRREQKLNLIKSSKEKSSAV